VKREGTVQRDKCINERFAVTTLTAYDLCQLCKRGFYSSLCSTVIFTRTYATFPATSVRTLHIMQSDS
jgi:hypothetical protein